MSEGHVVLVGAGPGDPGLITLRGMQALASADVVLYDYLSADELLDHAPPEAERIYVGKQAGRHSFGQQEINQLLIDRAQQGKYVVRLKGGDAFLFGRGGEECLALDSAGVSFEVIPGISSALAVPAYAGIPVTHRGLSSSLAIVTGHEDSSKEESALDWAALARIDTLVVLMGVRNLPTIVERLREAGRKEDTPVALIQWGTRGRQRSLVGTLADIDARVQAAGLGPPAIIVVGEVVRLRDALGWFDRLPLQGLRVLVTRTRQQASKLSVMLRALGAEPIECPLIEVVPPSSWEPLDQAVRTLHRYRWVVWTSANGVTTFFERLAAAGLDARALAGCRLAVIGSATAASLEAHGLRADLVPEGYTGESLAHTMISAAEPKGEAILVARSAIARPALVDLLEQAGALVDDVPAYDTVMPTGLAEHLEQALADVDVVTFTSSSAVRHLVKALCRDGETENLAKHVLACIGPVTADALRTYGLEPAVVAETHTISGLVEALVAYRANNKGKGS